MRWPFSKLSNNGQLPASEKPLAVLTSTEKEMLDRKRGVIRHTKEQLVLMTDGYNAYWKALQQKYGFPAEVEYEDGTGAIYPAKAKEVHG